MNVDIIGVPIDLGANRRGVSMGPGAIRYADLIPRIKKMGIGCNDLGNIPVTQFDNVQEDNENHSKLIKAIRETNTELAKEVAESVKKDNIPIVLGGDHSIAAGTIPGVQSVLKNIGVIWIDAHTDFNNEHTTESWNVHGMPLAACVGLGAQFMIDNEEIRHNFVDQKKIVLIGIRSIDEKEEELLATTDITVFTMEDIDVLGIREVMKRAIKIASEGTEGIHLSFDMDALSPNEAPGVGTPVTGGITYREAHLSLEMIAESKKLKSMEFVEVNPILDHKNQTGELAVSLICSALGKKIYRKNLEVK